MSEEKKDQFSLNLETGSGTEKSSESEVSDDIILAWVCHPAKRSLKITFMVTVFLLFLLLLVYWWTNSIWFVVLGALILFGSLSSFYFPTSYELSSEKITIKTKAQTQVKTWKQFRTYYPDKNGVLLSPFTRPSRLENFRGVYIRFWNNRDEVVDLVKKQMDARRISDEEVN